MERGMDMGWILILLIWLVAPFAQLGIIIGLLVSNDKYKKRIQELERSRLRDRALMPASLHDPECGKETWHSSQETPYVLSQPSWQPAPEQKEPPSPEKTTPQEQPLPLGTTPAGPKGSSSSLRSQKVFHPALGTLALVLGVVFIVLAGLIFATTTWQILTNSSKTCLVFGCTMAFFVASQLAQKVFGIRKTANACYILGSVFLFLSVLAAAHFKLLGEDFILEGENRWKVLFAGSAVTVGAFWAGLKRFCDRIYTQTCLWGMSLTMFFLTKACSLNWSGFLCVMTVYSAALAAVNRYHSNGQKEQLEGRECCRQLLAQEFHSFAPIHFWTFAAVTMVQNLFAVWCMVIEGIMGVRDGYADRFPMFSFTSFGAISMAAVMAGIFVLTAKEPGQEDRNASEEGLGPLKAMALAETALYISGCLADDFIWRTALVNLFLFVMLGIRFWRRKTSHGLHSLFCDICGTLAMVFTFMGFYSGGQERADGLALCLLAYGGYYVWFYLGERVWPHLLIAAAMIPFPFMARLRLGLTFDQMGWWTMAAVVIFGGAARHFCPILMKDDRVQGGWRIDWHHMAVIFPILLMAHLGNDLWRFVSILLAAGYFLQYTTVKGFRKPAFTLWAFCIWMAFLAQPFVLWPRILRLEMSLLPVVWFLWISRMIWKDVSWMAAAVNTGYALCLSILCLDALLTGQIVDALLVEGICLAVFVLAQVKNSLWWVRISASICLAAALFMTKGFWLSIAWWVYLLAAGVGLLIFAGIMEKKRR